MWRHLKFIYFFSTIYLSQEFHVDPLHDKFIDSITTMASQLVAQQKNLNAVAVVGTFCSSCELEREILRRVQSINQLPVIVIKHDSELVQQTTLTTNPWKSEFIVFHVITYSFNIRNRILDLDNRNRKVVYVINKPFRGKPFLWDNVWKEMFFVFNYKKRYNIYYIAFLNYQRAYLFTQDQNYKEVEVTVEDDIVQDRLKYISGNIINVAQYHNPPMSIIENGRVYGYDGKFLDVICKLLNVSYKLETLSSKVGRLDNDLVLSTLIHVTSTLAHFSFNTREASRSSAVSALSSQLSGTYPLEIMRVCAVIPRSDKYSTIMNIIKVFDPLIWLSIVVVFVGMGLIFWLSRKSSNLLDVYLSLWEIQLFGASTQRAALRWNKWLGILFVLYNFLILSFFSSDLVAFLTKPHYYNDINTLEELNRTSLDIFMSTTIALEIKAIRGKNYLFGSRSLVTGPFSFMVREVISKPYAGFITTENLFKLFLESKINQDSTGEARYHVVKECYFNTYRNYLSSEGNPYEEKVNLYQSWVNEAGLFIHWMRFVNYDFGSVDTKNYYVMTFMDFNVAFYILILGYLLAIAIFIVEMIFTKIKKRYFNH